MAVGTWDSVAEEYNFLTLSVLIWNKSDWDTLLDWEDSEYVPMKTTCEDWKESRFPHWE